MVITSQETEEEIEVISQHSIRKQKLALARLERRDFDIHDPLSIFRIIEERSQTRGVKKAYVEAQREAGEGTQQIPAIIDMTGSKKIMGAVAALAAWEFDAVPGYLDGDEYDCEMGRPKPGTERLLILDQAMSQFGGQEIEAARELFRAGAFGAAYEQFRRLAERIAYPERARLFRDISELYCAWCNLDMARLRTCTAQLKDQLDRVPLPTLHGLSRRLRQQLSFLEQLTQHEPDKLVLNHYLLGLHCQETHHYDFSTLLFYRTMEGCLVRRLELCIPRFDPRRPNYRLLEVKMAVSREDLEARYRERASERYSELD